MIEKKDTYFTLRRSIFESAIWSDNTDVLKLFIYLIGNVRHSKKPKSYPNFEIKRGEIVTSLADLSEDNECMKNGKLHRWSRSKVGRMLNILEKQEYITKLSDTYGTHIKVCNYDIYQPQQRTLSDTPDTGADTPDTGVGTNNKVNNGNNDNKDEDSLPLQEKFSQEVVDIVTNYHTYLTKHSKFKNYTAVLDWKIADQCDAIDKLNRIDGHTFETIQGILNFAIKDKFWHDKVLSLSRLRDKSDNGNKKFENIKLKLEGKPATITDIVDKNRKNLE